MANQMWFGIPGMHLQWVPCPLMGSAVQRNRYVERVQFQNGGGDATRSSQYQMEYQFSFSGPAHEVDGIDVFNKFAQGFYGNGYIELAHPAAFETNLLSAVWASPGIIEYGWSNIYTVAPVLLETGVTNYGQPEDTAEFAITTLANTPMKKITLVIPPTHTLYLGASYVATGTGVVQVRPTKVDYTLDTAVNLTPLSHLGSTRMNTTFNGAVHSSVDIYLTRTDATASTVAITSMMAQLYQTGTTPTLPSNHYQGEGSTGLAFVDDAIVENYMYMFPPRKGISTTLVEVEAWR